MSLMRPDPPFIGVVARGQAGIGYELVQSAFSLSGRGCACVPGANSAKLREVNNETAPQAVACVQAIRVSILLANKIAGSGGYDSGLTYLSTEAAFRLGTPALDARIAEIRTPRDRARWVRYDPTGVCVY